MKTCLRFLTMGLTMALLAAPAIAGGNANFFLGSRGLDKDFWTPVNGQFAFGGTVDFGKKEWLIHLETGTYVSVGYEENFLGSTDVTGSVSEIFFGVNKTWITKGPARPFIGGGLASVGAAYRINGPGGDIDDHDGSGGAYFHGGVFWRLGNRFNIGLDGRLLGGTKITLFGAQGDADYAQLGMVLGWGWPGGK
jgi:hypothetical protein